MKKLFTLLAVALTLPFLLSCNKDNRVDNIPTGSNFSHARTFHTEDGFKISFNADGSFLGLKPANKGVAGYDLIKGTYTYAEPTYTLYVEGTAWGTLEVKSGNTVHVSVTGLDTDFNVTSTVPNINNENQRASNHTWKPVSTIINYKGLTYSHDGVDLNNFVDWANENIGDIKETFKSNMKMTEAVITDNFIAFFFANGQQIAAEISLKDALSFDWNGIVLDGKESVDLFSGAASVAFSGDKLVFSFKGQFDGENAELIITFSL